MIIDKCQMVQLKDSKSLKVCRRARLALKIVAVVFTLVLAVGTAPVRLSAQQAAAQPRVQTKSLLQTRTRQLPETTHRFFDKTNVILFTGVAAVRALDFTSTEHFRSQGNNEVLLSNSIVDNKPLFAGIEVASTALSVGVAYWLHRTGHHKLERWVSIVLISVGAFGDVRNYTLGPPH
ncbi:MAG: hypothetical protein P8Z30_09065 [Acidobacteriota bacterium]